MADLESKKSPTGLTEPYTFFFCSIATHQPGPLVSHLIFGKGNTAVRIGILKPSGSLGYVAFLSIQRGWPNISPLNFPYFWLQRLQSPPTKRCPNDTIWVFRSKPDFQRDVHGAHMFVVIS